MKWIDELDIVLSRAETLDAVANVVIECTFRNIGVSGVTLCPLFQGASPAEEATLVCAAFDARAQEAARAHLMEALSVSDEDLGPVDSFFQKRTAVDCNEVVGPRLDRTHVYNDYWRPQGLHRQLLALVGAPDAPLGFLCWCRTRQDRAFDQADLRALDHIGRSMSPIFDRIAQARQGWFGLDAVVHALHVSLPQPCGLFDGHGRAVWLNEAAERMTGLRSTKTAAGLMLPGPRARLARWSSAVKRAAASTASIEPTTLGNLSVRRIDRPRTSSLFLVVAEGSSKTPHAGGLTQREAEIAELAAQGYSVLNIAARLGLSEGTVRNHLKHSYRKLGVGSRVELARLLWTH